MPDPNNAVLVNGIRKTFGSVVALADISFKVARGEVLALLGPNGAGKTTTVDILSTLTRPDRGHAEIAGHDVMTDPAGVRRSIMLTGQHVALDEALTGRENVIMFARLQGLRKSQARSRAKELLDQFDLVDAADRAVSTYSGGMRRRIDIACGLVVRPEVVFLDEPTTGLDPRSRQSIWELVSAFKEEGIATLLTTQYLEEADALSDRIIVIDHGTIIAEGTADELKERTGATYCEVVPRYPKDLPAVAQALGPLLPEKSRAALTTGSDRIAMPAVDGPTTLGRVLQRLSAANIELLDVALRRPSLDEVFLALTARDDGAKTAPRFDAPQTERAPETERAWEPERAPETERAWEPERAPVWQSGPEQFRPRGRHSLSEKSAMSVIGRPDSWQAAFNLVRHRGHERCAEPVQLPSGQWSHDYIDGGLAVDTGERLALVSEAIADLAALNGVEFDAVGGSTMGADPLAHGVAMVTGKAWFSVRKDPHECGRRPWIQGARLTDGTRVLLVDDVVSTGRSMLHAYERTCEAGAHVVAAIPLVDRGDTAAGLFSARGVAYLPLITYHDLGIAPVGRP